MTERFSSELLSLTPAEPGWTVDVSEIQTDPETRKRERSHEGHFPIIGWGVIRRQYPGGEEQTAVEPVFVTAHGLLHETEYRSLHSDPKPEPGSPKIVHHFYLSHPKRTDETDETGLADAIRGLKDAP